MMGFPFFPYFKEKHLDTAICQAGLLKDGFSFFTHPVKSTVCVTPEAIAHP